jgi:hypothetical protein
MKRTPKDDLELTVNQSDAQVFWDSSNIFESKIAINFL